MVVDKNAYADIQKEIVNYSYGLALPAEIESFNQHIESKLLNFKPTVMIYGTYNAGKSTLLNALFGIEEMAKTGDAPETKEVHEYKYNGYTIFDTPGMNARNDDDIVTKEHLGKSEVILFVISNNGSLEEEYVYTKISEVVKENKPIIIVLNNKTGINPDSLEAKEAMDKVGENLTKVGDQNNIEKIETKVSICMVNAKTALKGKLGNKQLMLKKSNILQLENMIEKVLKESGSTEVINALNIYIQNFLDSIIAKIDNKIDNIETKKTEELITYLEKLKQSSEIKLKNIVNKKIPNFIDNIINMLLSGTATEDDIETYISDTINDINQQASSISNNINSTLKTKIDNFSQEFKNLDAQYEYMDISDSQGNNDQESVISDKIKDKLKESMADSSVTKEGTKQVLTFAKKYLPKKYMFGKGPAWIGKVAGQSAVFIKVSAELYNVYSANKEHEQMIQKKRERTIGAKNSAVTLADTIQASLSNSIDEMVADTFNNLIIGFKDASKKLNGDNVALIEKKENLQSLSNRL